MGMPARWALATAVDDVGDAGPGGHRAHARAPGHARIAVGGVPRGLLVTRVDDADAVIETAVVDGLDVSPAQREEVRDAVAFQRLGDEPTAVYECHGAGAYSTRGPPSVPGRASHANLLSTPVSQASRVRIDQGSVVGPYVVERRLAHGGMSVLFLAKDRELQRDVVLKLAPEETGNAAAKARLLREARALAAVDHPGIVRVYGSGEHDGTAWIAMEHVRGKDLKQLLQEEGAVGFERALRWLVMTADALAAAHDAGVIHRDLKPGNLLLTDGEQIRIVDFGIARRRNEGSGEVLTSQREVIGTPAYLAPEQLEHGLADERSDVWALGCILYELCVGVPPFARPGAAQTVAAILRDEPAFPASLPVAVAQIIGACLRKSSFSRIGSPRELVPLLRDALDSPHGSGFSEAPASPFSSRPPSVAPPPPAPARASQLPSSSKTLAALPRAEVRSSARNSVPPPPRFSSSSAIRTRASSAPPPLVRGRLKGTAVRAGLLWFESTYGARALGKAFELGSPELRALLRPDDPAFGVIASGWYDMQCMGELLEHLERIADPEDPDRYRDQLAAAIAQDNVSGIYRSLFRLIASPALLEANAQRVWRTYSDEGVFTAKPREKGQLSFEVRGWFHHHSAVCSVLCYMVQNVLRELGFTAMIVERTRCAGEGDGYCAFEGMYLG